jgi:hypothetical protein
MTSDRSKAGALATALIGIFAGVTCRALPPPEPAASAPAAQPSSRPPDTPPPDPRKARELAVSAAVEHSAFLTRAGAEALVADQERRGQAVGDLEEAGLLSAINGFSVLPPARAREVGDSLGEVYARMSNDQRSRLESLFGQIRSGTAQPEHVAEAVTLLNEGASRLPAPMRARLQAQFEGAMKTSVSMRAEAAMHPDQGPVPGAYPTASLRAPARAPAVAGDPRGAAPARREAPEASGTGGSRDDRGEAYWRGRATAARAAVDAAQRRVADLEQRAARFGPIHPGPITAPCQAGVQTGGHRSINPDSANKTVTCNIDALLQQEGWKVQAELEQARAALERARRALEGLDEEARRAGALPGWLR